MYTAIGIYYNSFSMPSVYKIDNEEKFGKDPIHGYGMVKSDLWGITFFMDSFAGAMETGPDAAWPMWLYIDGNFGFIGSVQAEDKEMIKWMEQKNGIDIENGSFKAILFMRVQSQLGLQWIWDFNKARIGLAVGIEMLMEFLTCYNDDINLSPGGAYFGPSVKFSMKF